MYGLPTGLILVLLLGASCATYDSAVDYRSRLEAFAHGAPPSPVAALARPEAFWPQGLAAPPMVGTVPQRLETLLDWMGPQLTFDGGAGPIFPLTAETIWQAGLRGSGINCRAASVVFASLVEAQGLPARVLYLYPRDLSNDNHVVVLVWWADERRWIVADPSYRTLFRRTDERALGPVDLRDAVANGTAVQLSPGARWNGEPVEPNYLHYLSKNLYRWAVPAAQGGWVQLVPSGYAGWGPPWGWSTVVHDPVAFLAPP